MRRLVVKTMVLAFLITGIGVSAAQQPRTKPKEGNGTNSNQGQTGSIVLNEKNFDVKTSKLEQMLAEALKNNPDIRVAVAKLAEADAELNRTRLLVTQKVIDLHHALLSQKAVVEYEQKRFERMKKLAAQNSISSEILDEAQQKLTIAKAKLAELEAQMPAILGKVAHAEGKASEALRKATLSISVTRLYPLIGPAELIRTPRGDLEIVVKNSQRAAGPMADKIRQALDKPISLKMSNVLASEVLAHLQKQTGVTFKLTTADGFPDPKLNLEFTELSLRAALQYIEDSEPGYRFVIREYGILFAPEAKLPPGALTVQEFLRQKPAEK